MKTAVVTLTDEGYFRKAKRTILDIRTRGEWQGDLVLITVGFDAPRNFLDFYRIIGIRMEHLDTRALLEGYRACPILPTCDNREYSKLTQWDKFYVFDSVFQNWDRIVYFDAGMRVVDRVQRLVDLPCDGVLMAPDDAAPHDQLKRFGGIIETDRNPPVCDKFFKEFDRSIIGQRYFLNCIWMYDTRLLRTAPFQELVRMMNDYPICRCNEMTVMNLLFTFKLGAWKPFPEFVSNADGSQKRLFGWTEHDHHYGSHTTWRDFCFLKYPSTLNMECE